MLSVELRRTEGNPLDELEIYCDAGGLESLMAQLRLLQQGRTEHVHMMTPSWGGTHLDDAAHGPNGTPIRHVKIILQRESLG
jgi:hypothetical protein